MDCADALERIEIAAAEPDGLERLMAGDTPDGAAVAGHLAACPACMAELAAIRRSASTIREAIATAPDEGLRERTLAYVRTMGRERGTARSAPAVPKETGAAAGSLDGPSAASASATVAAAPEATRRPSPAADAADAGIARPAPVRLRLLGWVAAVAASAVIAAGLTAAVLVPGRDAEIARQAGEIGLLSRVTGWTMRVEARPDAQRMALAGAGDRAGSLVYSPSSGELVVVAEGLEAPPAGTEYGCWLETADGRRWIGRMYFGGDMAAWAGPVEGLDAMATGAAFRVSLGQPGAATPGEPVLWTAP